MSLFFDLCFSGLFILTVLLAVYAVVIFLFIDEVVVYLKKRGLI